MKVFEGDFTVGDRVQISEEGRAFPAHEGRTDLVVLHMDADPGYGVGPKGNSPDRWHDGKYGWLWYFPEEIEAAK